MPRRALAGIAVLAVALHAWGIAGALLPAQDGLKFLRIAARFQTLPWPDVVRGSDQHPLYPALIAFVQPGVAEAVGSGHESWRIAAQLVSALASLALLIPLYHWSRHQHGPQRAALAVVLFLLLPLPTEVGHDTLSDSLGLLAVVLSLDLGAVALESRRLGPALGCGLAAGIGYLARPEVILAPIAVVLTGLTLRRGAGTPSRSRMIGGAAVALSALVMVGGYALVKGEVSEKLALRFQATPAGRPTRPDRPAPQWLPPGLNDPRWDFAPKEESQHPHRIGPWKASVLVARRWAEGMGWILAPLALWGLAGARGGRRVGVAGRLTTIYAGLFALVLVRHTTALSYLSGRHLLSLVAVSVPWAAVGLADVWGRARDQFGLSPRWGCLTLAGAIAAGVALQAAPSHPSRWGHWAAGRWLAEHAGPGDAVLDTRGWAAFVSELPSYDYWHVRQSFTDAHLRFIVVGADELAVRSRRAATLRAILDYAATRAASFPARKGGAGADVLVYRFRRPESWEGLIR